MTDMASDGKIVSVYRIQRIVKQVSFVCVFTGKSHALRDRWRGDGCWRGDGLRFETFSAIMHALEQGRSLCEVCGRAKGCVSLVPAGDRRVRETEDILI